jgi:hypothetical protein
MQATTARDEVRWKSRLTRLWTDKGATELVEFAIVMPLLCMVLFGMFWFGRAFNIYETLTRAAREGAAYGARPSCALCANGGIMGGFPTADQIASTVTPQLQAARISVNDLAVLPQPTPFACKTSNGFLDPNSPCPVSNNQQRAPCDSSQGGRIWVCRCVNMKPNDNSGAPFECGVSVTMAYPWKFRFPFTGMDDVIYKIPATVQERQEF